MCKNRSFFKRSIRAVLSFFLVGAFALNVCAEDIYYLTCEIKDAEAKLLVYTTSRDQMKAFLAAYPQIVAELQSTYDEVLKIEEKQKNLLKKNLIKSTIVLGLETYGKISLVVGFYQKSLKIIITAVGSEIASNAMQNSFSSPYTIAVQGLSDKAAKMLPEAEALKKTMAMSQEEVKQEAMKEGVELGETGVIYRKFYMVLEAIEKVKKAIYEIRKELDATKAKVEAELPQVLQQIIEIEKRINELKKRLDVAYKEKNQAMTETIQSQAEQKGSVTVTPVPMHVRDDEERQALINQLTSQLSSTLNVYETKAREKNDALNTEISAPASEGASPYNPMSCSPEILAVEQFTDKDIEKMGYGEAKNYSEQFYPYQIAQNRKYIKIVDSYVRDFEKLLDDFKGAVTPIINQLAGLGADYQSWRVKSISNQISGPIASLPEYKKKFEKEIEVMENNMAPMKNRMSRVVDEANAAARRMATPAANAIEAASFVKNKADKGMAEIKNAGLLDSNGNLKLILSDVKGEVQKMYMDGRCAEVPDFLKKKKSELMALYQPLASIPRLVAERDNLYYYGFINEAEADPGYGTLRQLIQYHPELKLKDPMPDYSEQYYRFVSYVTDESRFDKVNAVAQKLYEIANQINDLIPAAQEIIKIDNEIRDIYSGSDFDKAVQKHVEIMKKAATLEDGVLDKWRIPVAWTAFGNVKMYDILSKSTRDAKTDFDKRLKAKQDAESKAAAEELKKKEEAEGRNRAKENLERGLADYYGYSVYDARINSYNLMNMPGEVVFTDDEMKSGKMELTGRLSTLEKVKKILIAFDGSSWQELPVQQAINFSFNPMPNKKYKPQLRILTTDSEDVSFDIYGRETYVIYRNIRYPEMITATIKAICDSYEQQNISKFSNLISRDFVGNKTFLEEGVRTDFDLFMDIRLRIYINRIEKRNNILVAETKWDKSQVPRKTGQEQKTSGLTTMMFVYEDGMMKISNLRGNLIYATLSPEIAESSGLSSAVVEQVREAAEQRNPVQPGAGTTLDSGGVSSGLLTVRNGTLDDMNSFNFESGTQGLSGDLSLETNILTGNGFQRVQGHTGSFDSLTEAPSTGYDVTSSNLVAGNVYVFITARGLYGKLEITNAGTGLPGGAIAFRYVLQTDGSKNLAT